MAVPEIDSELGLHYYSTEFQGCKGRIRNEPKDFEVDEVLSAKGKSLIGSAGNYPVFLLTKSGIDTKHALSHLARRTGIRLRSLGLKDARAVTTQYVYSNKKTRGPEKFQTSMYALYRIGFTDKPLSKRLMVGNRFSIRVVDNSASFDSFDEDQRILNYYGYQRFGSTRPVTHLIGKALIQGRYSDAVRYILSHPSKYDTGANARIREEMADPSTYAQVYERIPPGMDLERRVMSGLIDHGDPFRAIMSLRVDMRRFYIQAYQSYLFNLTVSRAFGCGEDLFSSADGDVCYDVDGTLCRHVTGSKQSLAIPIVGYAYYAKTRFHEYISEILRQEGVRPRDFYVRDIQDASGEGGFRNAAIRVDDFDADDDRASFMLSRGSFATIVMREIIKPENPLQSGF